MPFTPKKRLWIDGGEREGDEDVFSTERPDVNAEQSHSQTHNSFS